MYSEIDQKLIDGYRLHLLEKGLNAVIVNRYMSNISFKTWKKIFDNYLQKSIWLI